MTDGRQGRGLPALLSAIAISATGVVTQVTTHEVKHEGGSSGPIWLARHHRLNETVIIPIERTVPEPPGRREK
jgi:hypothetical protein